jgi:hypothetical protein
MRADSDADLGERRYADAGRAGPFRINSGSWCGVVNPCGPLECGADHGRASEPSQAATVTGLWSAAYGPFGGSTATSADPILAVSI